MAWNLQNVASGVGLYLLVIGVLFGRTNYYPRSFEKTDTMKSILKAEKRGDKKDFALTRSEWTQAEQESKSF